MELRNNQDRVIRETRAAIAEGKRTPLVVAPCGFGKTHVAAAMIRGALEKGKRALFLAPRRELIYQTSERLDSCDIRYGVIMAGEPPSLMTRVQVASIPTLHARAVQRKRIWLPDAELVLVDEAHIGIGGQAAKIVEHYRSAGAVVVGLTATPARTDGRGLGELYDALVEGPTVAELVRDGYLVPARYFVGDAPDLKGVKVQAGDYHQGQLAERTDKPKLVGDVVQNWLRLASDRQTFVFAVNVAHSMHLCDEFRAAGVAAEHIDAKTPLDERRAIQARLQSGETQVVCNVLVMSYGVDFPPVSCIVHAAPTKSVVRYLQSVGRGLRTHPGKTDCLVLDHAGAVSDPALGFVDDPRPWSLDGSEKIQDRQAAQVKQPKEIKCGKCGATFRAARTCPKCGNEMGAKYSKAIQAFEAELVEVDRKGKKPGMSVDEKAQFFAELKHEQQRLGKPDGWSASKYRDKVGDWPNDPRIRNVSPAEPTTTTLNWIKHCNMKWAKSRRNPRNQGVPA